MSSASSPLVRLATSHEARRFWSIAWHRVVPRLLEILAVVVATMFVFSYAAKFETRQGDLRTYLSAAEAASSGQDPYDPATLQTIAGRPVMPFVYPPIALLAFLPLVAGAKAFVMAAFMWSKVALFFALTFYAWRRFAPDQSPIAVLLVFLYGANRAAQWDLSSGNLALIETAALLAAFECWARGHRRAFAALVVIASLFKLAPIVFLALLLVPLPTGAARPRVLGASLLVFALLIGGPMLVGPAAHWRPFFSHLPDATLYQDTNPSSLGFLTLVAARLGIGAPLSVWVGRALWCGLVILLAVGGRRWFRSLWQRQDATAWAMTAMLLYVTIHPRVMIYGYVLAAPAMLYFLPSSLNSRSGGLLWALLLSAQGLAAQLTSNYAASVFAVYAPFLLCLVAWLLRTMIAQHPPLPLVRNQPT